MPCDDGTVKCLCMEKSSLLVTADVAVHVALWPPCKKGLHHLQANRFWDKWTLRETTRSCSPLQSVAPRFVHVQGAAALKTCDCVVGTHSRCSWPCKNLPPRSTVQWMGAATNALFLIGASWTMEHAGLHLHPTSHAVRSQVHEFNN